MTGDDLDKFRLGIFGKSSPGRFGRSPLLGGQMVVQRLEDVMRLKTRMRIMHWTPRWLRFIPAWFMNWDRDPPDDVYRRRHYHVPHPPYVVYDDEIHVKKKQNERP